MRRSMKLMSVLHTIIYFVFEISVSSINSTGVHLMNLASISETSGRTNHLRHGVGSPIASTTPPSINPENNTPRRSNSPRKDTPEPGTQHVSAPEPRPLSPWARRFGVARTRDDQIYHRSSIEHSRYAPSRK